MKHKIKLHIIVSKILFDKGGMDILNQTPQ